LVNGTTKTDCQMAQLRWEWHKSTNEKGDPRAVTGGAW
jgi:hypothetical protein